MNRIQTETRRWIVAVTLAVAVAGCEIDYRLAGEHLPYALSTAGNGIVHIGRHVPNARPGEVVEYGNLDLPDGVVRAWVEVDSDGNAASFELWYEQDKDYASVAAYYNGLLGPPTNRYARVAGHCFVWEDRVARFEVCMSREAGEHGTVIAHVYPVTPVAV